MRTKFYIAGLIVLFSGLALGCGPLATLIDGSGTRFVIEVETDATDRNAITDLAVRTIEIRLSGANLTGKVARSKDVQDRIEVMVFGNHEPEVLKKWLFVSHRLELKPVVSPPSPKPVQIFPSRQDAEKSILEGQEVRPYKERDLVGQEFVILESRPIVTGEDIRTANAVSRLGTDYQINFGLKPDGATRLGEWTAKNINNYLAVVLDDQVVSIAYIKSQITDSGEISGSFMKTQAEEIANSLRSGYLPATLRVVETSQLK